VFWNGQHGKGEDGSIRGITLIGVGLVDPLLIPEGQVAEKIAT
jgi:hypothetical protein